MPLAILTFLTGMAISAVAIYYSVLGLASIFSAAAIPIMIMGTILELSKLVSAWWLKANWTRAPFLLKSYMLIAVVVLMLITSMGIFGFLSKAHSDQAIPTGDTAAKIQIIDDKISIQKEYITQARKDIEQLNTQIDRYNELGAVSKGVKIREQQKAEREKLLTQIEDAQNKITKLREERAPIAASMRAIEAEVGPIKYIAAFVYGDNPDANILEKAVTWVIITIIFVFDPLAVLLLLSSQMSFQWRREAIEQEEKELYGWEDEWTAPDPFIADVGEKPTSKELEEINKEPATEKKMDEPHKSETHPYLRQGFEGYFKNLKPLVAKEEKNEEQNETPQAIFQEQAEKDLETQIREEIEKDVALFIQNEEQNENSVWSKIISQDDYLKKSKELKKQALINRYADLVRDKKIPMSMVPTHLLLEVRALV